MQPGRSQLRAVTLVPVGTSGQPRELLMVDNGSVPLTDAFGVS